jgi:predicted ferric reductase
MKKAFWIALFAASLGVPLALYLSVAGTGLDTYTFAIIAAITAYILICDQVILAAKPSGLINAFGAKFVARLHSTLPVAILTIAALHPMLKGASGFSDETAQARIGSISLVALAFLSAFTVIFMANTVWLRITPLAALKKWASSRLGLTYPVARIVHGFFALIAVAIAIHALLASTSNVSVNPIGAAWLCGMTILSLFLYIRYRVQRRKRSQS